MSQLYDRYTSSTVLTNYTEREFTKWGNLCFKKQVFPFFPKARSSKVLEVGCGYGRYLLTLQELGYTELCGIDISKEQIEIGKEELHLKNLHLADALEFLRIETQMYDAILMLDVLEHLELEYSIALTQEAHKHLNPNGVLIIQVPNALSPMSPIRYGDLTHKRAYTVTSLEQLLVLGGFSHTNYHPLPPIVHGLKSAIRRTAWDLLISPLIKAYFLFACGSKMGNIYTPNLLVVAKKVI